tara:strand:+ start:550 stop:705 length:156 start_codon:yes stop_codon:yes gene_type:complete
MIYEGRASLLAIAITITCSIGGLIGLELLIGIALGFLFTLGLEKDTYKNTV